MSRSLTSEMISAVDKLMSSIDLIMASQKMRFTGHCNTTIDERGRLAFRCQPNHHNDLIEGILFSIKEGLSYGSGDAVICVNPNIDSLKRFYRMTDEFIQEWTIQTQNCVLAHITTQIDVLGAPMALMIQSLAGTQQGNEAFGVSRHILDEGYSLMKKRGTSTGPNFMCFETGQVSGVSHEADQEVDMQTLEARTYGYARQEPIYLN